MNREPTPTCFIHFDKNLCNSCIDCVRACPTKAIRIRNNQTIRMVDQCIGCGECIRVCPKGAMTAATATLASLEKDKMPVALVHPTLYAQFPGIAPMDLLAAVKNLGFHHVMDLSHYIEMFQCATEEFIRRNRVSQQAPWPLISPFCPVAIHLIAVLFPSLLHHILPIMRPVVLAGREIKRRLAKEYRVLENEVVTYYITPNRASYPFERSYVDRALGINDVYAQLIRQIEQFENNDSISSLQDQFNITVTGNGLMWAISGGEIAGLNIESTLAVSGIRETMAYLEKIELGLFGDTEYIELRTCPDGCVGGVLTGIDRHLAKSAVLRMVPKLDSGRRLPREKILRLYEKGRFMAETMPSDLEQLLGTTKEHLSLESLQKVENLLESINGMNCAACGSPDCRTFCEDVVMGRAALRDCLLIWARENGGDTSSS